MEDIRDQAVTAYFRLGLNYIEILSMLAVKENIVISERTLKRILSKLNLTRRLNWSSHEEVKSFIEQQIQISGRLHGYKWIHLKCIQSGLVVSQETVRRILKHTDPVGVDIRTRRRLRRRLYFNKGPNYLWHVDSYDKLKPYGICINGCIDGYSRYIVWLRAGFTSSGPKVIGGYFIDAIKETGGCPLRMRSDMGTENRFIEQIQIYLRRQDNEEHPNAFLYGSSPSNQRIESWWGILRKHNAQFWMNLFQQLKDDNYFTGSFVDKALIQFCFMKVIQDELDTVVLEWNSHRITQSKNSISPAGRPVVLYNVPQIYNSKNYLCDIECDKLSHCLEECTFHGIPCDEDIYELCNLIVQERGFEASGDPFQCASLYVKLKTEFLELGL